MSSPLGRASRILVTCRSTTRVDRWVRRPRARSRSRRRRPKRTVPNAGPTLSMPRDRGCSKISDSTMVPSPAKMPTTCHVLSPQRWVEPRSMLANWMTALRPTMISLVPGRKMPPSTMRTSSRTRKVAGSTPRSRTWPAIPRSVWARPPRPTVRPSYVPASSAARRHAQSTSSATTAPLRPLNDSRPCGLRAASWDVRQSLSRLINDAARRARLDRPARCSYHLPILTPSPAPGTAGKINRMECRPTWQPASARDARDSHRKFWRVEAPDG